MSPDIHDKHPKISPWIRSGFNLREAAHMAGIEPSNTTLNSRTRASEMSPRMLDMAKQIANKKIQEHATKLYESAKPEENPHYYALNHTSRVANTSAANLNDALKEFSSSGALEGKLPHEKIAAINQFKANWLNQNKDTQSKVAADTAKQHFAIHDEAWHARKKQNYDTRKLIQQGGVSIPTEQSSLYSEQPDVDYYNSEDNDKEDIDDLM
jgi:hypothetical protein